MARGTVCYQSIAARTSVLVCVIAAAAALASSDDVRSQAAAPSGQRQALNDSHLHLTNYVQEGTKLPDLLAMMGKRVGRAAVFGIPLQQQWSYSNSGDYAPTYYLQSDAPLYYYSFIDAHIALAYLALPATERRRFDPMIIGFNPADMYAVEHIRRMLETFPGVFTGIGEFTIHKEFVSSKIAGGPPSLRDPALDRVLRFAGEVGLVVLIHNDVDVPFAKPEDEPAYLAQMRDVLAEHPQTTIIWAHTGLGRVVRPLGRHAAILEAILADPRFAHVSFDISWNEVAKYMLESQESLRLSASLINRYPDRFLYGSDEVAPPDAPTLLRVFDDYTPLWNALTPEASRKVRKGNYERLFDAARGKVRAWERAHVRGRRAPEKRDSVAQTPTKPARPSTSSKSSR